MTIDSMNENNREKWGKYGRNNSITSYSIKSSMQKQEKMWIQSKKIGKNRENGENMQNQEKICKFRSDVDPIKNKSETIR